MTGALLLKLLRDIRLPLGAVAVLLGGFHCLWAKITQRITEEILPSFKLLGIGVKDILDLLFKGPGQIIQTLVGGENINFTHALDVLSIGYVHPLNQAILCVWAVGRSAGAVAGEIDRGTMELLLAQPLARWRVILANGIVDVVAIVALCFAVWTGDWAGVAFFGRIDFDASPDVAVLRVDPVTLLPGLAVVAALLFAVGGYTTWISSLGRFRGRVLGTAVLMTLLQFLINVIGQLWDPAAILRPFTVFYYFQPQQLILHGRWSVDLAECWHGQSLLVNGVVVLAAVGVVGYGLAWWTFCRRDLPAPL
jgi:ABC-2 type transport system permease protein